MVSLLTAYTKIEKAEILPGRYWHNIDPRIISSFLKVGPLLLLNLSNHEGKPEISRLDNTSKFTDSTHSRQALCNVLHVASLRALSASDNWFMIWASTSTGRSEKLAILFLERAVRADCSTRSKSLQSQRHMKFASHAVSMNYAHDQVYQGGSAYRSDFISFFIYVLTFNSHIVKVTCCTTSAASTLIRSNTKNSSGIIHSMSTIEWSPHIE